MQTVRPGNYDPVIDILRAISILAVICIHTTTRTMETVNLYLPKVPVAIFLNQISRFAVPMFFLISGFVLELSHKDGLGYFGYLKKRLGKILIPYVFWSAIYYFFIYTRHGVSFWQALAGGNSSYQLYFIPSLFLLYLVFPLLHAVYRWISRWWVIIPILAIQIWLLYLDYYPREINLWDPLRIVVLNSGCFLAGMIASQNTDKIKELTVKFKFILAPAAGLLGIFIFREGGSRYLTSWNYIDFYSQWRPSIFIYTLGLFGLGYTWLSRPGQIFLKLAGWANESFLVFFIHVIILEKVWELFNKVIFGRQTEFFIRQWWWDPVFFLVVAGGSFLAARLIHKIPYIQKVTG